MDANVNKTQSILDFPGGPVVGTPHLRWGGVGSIPDQGTKIPRAVQRGHKKREKKRHNPSWPEASEPGVTKTHKSSKLLDFLSQKHEGTVKNLKGRGKSSGKAPRRTFFSWLTNT